MSIIVPEEIKKTFGIFESRKDSFGELELHEALRRAFKITKEVSQDVKNGCWVESAAFHFSELPAGESSEWGTHFGPMAASINKGINSIMAQRGELYNSSHHET